MCQCKCRTSGSHSSVQPLYANMSLREPHVNNSSKSYRRSEMCALLSGNVRVIAASWLVFCGLVCGRHRYLPRRDTFISSPWPVGYLWTSAPLSCSTHQPLQTVTEKYGGGGVLDESRLIITLQACVSSETSIPRKHYNQPCTTALSVSTCSLPQA